MQQSITLARALKFPLTATALVLATSTFAAAQDESPRLSSPYPDASRGEAAVQALGDRMEDVAAKNGLGKEELARLLTEDSSAWLDSKERVFFVDEMPAARQEPSRGGSILAASSIPTSEAFKLHSRPSANRIIYLDFTGHHSVNNAWGHNIQFPPFNTSGSSSTFTEGELLSIIAHWQHIAEDFAPFDVDVTTEEPPTHRLIKSGGGDTQWGVRDIHTQPTSGFGNGIGGVAYLNSFNDSTDNPVFSFNKGDNTGSMTGSHEVGHALGLSHDGLGGSSYHPGTGSGATSWGPIMGAPFGESLVQWSNGDYSGSTTTQDDYSIITKNTHGLTFKPDDFGNTIFTASPLGLGCSASVVVEGLIERRTDKDAFRFESSGGLHSINVEPFSPGGNLDILVELFGPTGALIASNNPTNNTNANINATLGTGTHTIIIDGVGKSGVYSDYGSVGQYTLTVDGTSSSGGFNNLGGGLSGFTSPVLTGSGSACAGSTVSLFLAGGPANSPAYFAYGVGQLNAPFLGGTLVPNVGVGGGILALSTSLFGSINIGAPLPAPVPSGISVVFQYWVVDSGGPQGFAASNAIELVFP